MSIALGAATPSSANLVSGDTSGSKNDFENYAGFGTLTGPDDLYQFDIDTGQTVTLSLAPVADLALVLAADGGDIENSVLDFADAGFAGVTETITFTQTGPPTTLYVVVDGFGGAASAYQLDADSFFLTLVPEPVPAVGPWGGSLLACLIAVAAFRHLTRRQS